ncbi:MAG: hypothetical protein COA88_00115 [Kordia sp.]|nr:MAG: hypothetical protein COA88_00115 [Kordia sp.]
MKEFFKSTIRSLGFSIATLFTLNTIVFILTLNEYQIAQDWSFKLEKGVFLINNVASGFEFGKMETNGLLLMLFFLGIFMNFKNPPLKAKQISTSA